MSQQLPVNHFKWVKGISKFDESFVKSYTKESDKEYFLEVDVQYPKDLHNLRNDLSFLPERMKIEKVEKLVATISDKNCETRTPSPLIQCWLQVCLLISGLGCLAWLLQA